MKEETVFLSIDYSLIKMAKILRNLDKKGQIHISETIAVLFIFFILVVFGLVFYFKYAEYSLKEEQDQLATARAIRLTSKTLFLPELACTKGEAEAEDDCIDMMKLRNVQEVLDLHLSDYYYSIFGYANVSVVREYPLPKERWTVYDLPRSFDSNQPSLLTPRSSTFFTVTLRDESLGGEKIPYGFGYIQVEVYE